MPQVRIHILIALVLALFAAPALPAVAAEKPAAKPHIVIITCEDEYDAKTTLPAFAKEFNKDEAYRITHLTGNEKKTDIPGLAALESADLLVLYFRRTTLPPEQLDKFKAYFDAGKPLVAIRTTSHGFQNWLEFDRTVLGATYGGHHNNKTEGSEIRFVEKQKEHPILAGVKQETYRSTMWVYKYPDLVGSATVLMAGKFKEHVEPVTWTNTYKGGRIFYTSLGHPDDFKDEKFTKMLGNAVKWCLETKK